MQPMWLCIFSGRQFEETFENTQWRKVKQMQPMWLYIFSGRQFEDTFESAQRRKVKQMQPMWLCIHSSKQFEDSFEISQKNQCNQCDFASSLGRLKLIWQGVMACDVLSVAMFIYFYPIFRGFRVKRKKDKVKLARNQSSEASSSSIFLEHCHLPRVRGDIPKYSQGVKHFFFEDCPIPSPEVNIIFSCDLCPPWNKHSFSVSCLPALKLFSLSLFDSWMEKTTMSSPVVKPKGPESFLCIAQFRADINCKVSNNPCKIISDKVVKPERKYESKQVWELQKVVLVSEKY